ncbi:hypothetical protein SPRG_02966 [Saprolegnia parasitica CBS 223.65]|uniref:Uncharacterized protein n=1 Tax=Saprolegnia parasitica (strain CBS 223.65) TaxID=695850 RepID=A0A067CP55_SAPPC|nr:hypothetical protein SPRG_02966 [Saprolegnia parasitica CBS 223.65]KDO32489.1 hypothetical protein SPRG_02966 [Saprolegnia parasitica CBS 223.65]|eukprot:XP_012196938.1 hypothetical protein SPRG_02966 [Saprolegnia parasitica CBS 223.65]
MLQEDDLSTREILYDIEDARRHDPADPKFQKRLFERQRKREYRKQTPHELRYLTQRVAELKAQIDMILNERAVQRSALSWKDVAAVFAAQVDEAIAENKSLRRQIDELTLIRDELQHYILPATSSTEAFDALE